MYVKTFYNSCQYKTLLDVNKCKEHLPPRIPRLLSKEPNKDLCIGTNINDKEQDEAFILTCYTFRQTICAKLSKAPTDTFSS